MYVCVPRSLVGVREYRVHHIASLVGHTIMYNPDSKHTKHILIAVCVGYGIIAFVYIM